MELTVNGQNFRIKSGSGQLVRGTINYVSAVYSFSDEWRVWKSPDGQVYDVALDTTDGATGRKMSLSTREH